MGQICMTPLSLQTLDQNFIWYSIIWAWNEPSFVFAFAITDSQLLSPSLSQLKRGEDIQEAAIPLACEVFNLPYLTIFFSQWGVNKSTISSEKQSQQTMSVFISWSLTKPKVRILSPDAKSQDEISKWSTMCPRGKWRPDNKGAGF